MPKVEPRAGIKDVGEDFDEAASALTRNVRERYIYGSAEFGRCALHPAEPKLPVTTKFTLQVEDLTVLKFKLAPFKV